MPPAADVDRRDDPPPEVCEGRGNPAGAGKELQEEQAAAKPVGERARAGRAA